MSNNWKTTEQLIEGNKKLRAKLEAKHPGCTAKIPVPEDYLSLDNIFDEENDLKAVESGLASQQAVEARGATVVARYTTQAATPNTAEKLSIDPAKFRQAIAEGKISRVALNQHAKVREMKAQLAAENNQNSLSAKCLRANIAKLEATMPPLFPEK